MSYKWTTYMMAQLDTLPVDQRSTRHAQIKEALEEGYLCGVVEMLFDELKESRAVGDDLTVLLEEKDSQLEEAKAEIKFTREQFAAFQKQQEGFTQAGLKATAESSALMVQQAAQLEEAKAEIKFTRKQFAASSALMVAQGAELSAALQQQECSDAWMASAAAEIEELKIQLAKVTQERNDRAADAAAAYMKIGELSMKKATE